MNSDNAKIAMHEREDTVDGFRWLAGMSGGLIIIRLVMMNFIVMVPFMVGLNGYRLNKHFQGCYNCG